MVPFPPLVQQAGAVADVAVRAVAEQAQPQPQPETYRFHQLVARKVPHQLLRVAARVVAVRLHRAV